MKLATSNNGSKDGQLIIVSKDLSRYTIPSEIAPTMQNAMDNWDTVQDDLVCLSKQLENGKVEAKPFLDPRGLFPLNQKEVAILLISFWILFWVGSIFYLFFKYESFKWVRNLSFFFALLFAIPFLAVS